MQRGSDRLSVRKDDERKHELQGMLRSGRPTRVEEWHDPEPAADDDPQLTGPAPTAGSLGQHGWLKGELGRHLGRGTFPATRGDLVRALTEQHAPDWLVATTESLPDHGTYRSAQDVVHALPETV